MAKLWGLPAVALCENNSYGMGTSTQRHSANTAVRVIAAAAPVSSSVPTFSPPTTPLHNQSHTHTHTTPPPFLAALQYYKQGGVAIPGIWCDGMDVLAVRCVANTPAANRFCTRGVCVLPPPTHTPPSHACDTAAPHPPGTA